MKLASELSRQEREKAIVCRALSWFSFSQQGFNRNEVDETQGKKGAGFSRNQFQLSLALNVTLIMRVSLGHKLCN